MVWRRWGLVGIVGLVAWWGVTVASAWWPLPGIAHAASAPPRLPVLPPFSNTDRLLVVAPHEDDETLGAGGLIQHAVAAGAAVRVVYLTYGDHNELAFILYRRRPWVSPAVNEGMGELRRREAIAAMAHLGVPADHLVFLGYPDGDTLNIWRRSRDRASPLRSRATQTRTVPYPDAASYGKPYTGASIVADLDQQLLAFHPTRLVVTQQVDGHPDHRACYLFVQVALRNVAGQIPPPQVYTYPIHMGMWPHPYGYHPDRWLSVPDLSTSHSCRWWMVPLTPEQVARKYEALREYRSQLIDARGWLTAFARRNEVFCKDDGQAASYAVH